MRCYLPRYATSSGSLLWLLAAFCFFTVPAWAQQAVDKDCAPQFCRVDDKIYRGEQPEIPAGIAELQRRGIKTIINLRGRDKNTAAEEQAAQAAGITYVSQPLPALSAPTDAEVNAVLAEIEKAEGPVFLHCHHGEDRTGLIVACYRINHGWTYEQAMKEAKQHGISRLQFGMRRYIKKYATRHSK